MNNYRIVYRNASLDAPEGEFLVGRSTDCNLVLDDPSVSRVHFAIVRQGDRLFVEDRGSRNGIKVNGVTTKERIELKDGDRLDIGHQTILIQRAKGVAEGEKTIGLSMCRSCGTWMAASETACHHCGAPRQSLSAEMPVVVEPTAPRADEEQTGVVPQASMLASLAQKAIRVSKLDEAEHLLATALSHIASKFERGREITGGELLTVGMALIDLALAQKSSAHISNVFRLHKQAKKLLAREIVERLYEVVRPVGYYACSEMNDYLTVLGGQSASFSPGERFIHRRIEGLVKLCS